ncbi:uncharacterized protein LOC126792702 isoform X2 [Argentina anserina]|uniref:uncharacterized protein LOC126792702 isoform X2 n=1 Tax=Argentina anserina TaxID=57926 RepID=UPI0021762311|nr:uncharacterized protein LOC126792702 isoform X2 [Potentilla anserina]
MGLLIVNSATSLTWRNSIFTCGRCRCIGLYDLQNCLPTKSCTGVGSGSRAFASRNSVKKLRRERLASERGADKTTASSENVQNDNKLELSDDSAAEKGVNIPSRGAVLQACTVTSGLIVALGFLIRQASHVASVEGLPVLDCSLEVSFDFETWHLQLIAGLVILISSSRYLLLKTWPEFAESSKAANEQELLFRGALQPLFGSSLSSAMVVALVFGALHLGGGRKYSFAVWASFVGFVYGYATIASSSLVVPMVSHAMNNLVGGILWKYSSDSSREISDSN